MRRIIVEVLAPLVCAGVFGASAGRTLKGRLGEPGLAAELHPAGRTDRIGRDFTVTVNTPSATVFLPGQKLPAIYALDSGYGLAGAQGSLLSNTGAMEPAIIVSVGYLPGQALFRNTDLLHNKTTQDKATYGGGGAAFEAFLLEDLRPFIEARFPADPARAVLFGHSFGGLFAANVFADKPEAFFGYVIGSVSAWADPDLIRRVAEAAPKAHGQRIFLSVGEKEGSVCRRQQPDDRRLQGQHWRTEGPAWDRPEDPALRRGDPSLLLSAPHHGRLSTWALPPAMPLGAAWPSVSDDDGALPRCLPHAGRPQDHRDE